MNADRFDSITRELAANSRIAVSRRVLLRALGLGGTAAVLGTLSSSAAPELPRRRSATPAQDEKPVAAEIDELAFSLEYDLDQLFAYVRDQVAYDPYSGVLRGATGTLWGLAGNAADQAMLLAELLRAGMIRTRFVEGELRQEAVSTLLAAGALVADAAGQRNQRLYAPTLGDDAFAGDAPAPSAEEVDQFSGFAAKVQSLVAAHTAEGIATVTEALAQAGVTLPLSEVAVPELERTRHIWLQYASGQEWIDLDPSLPNAQPGDVFAQNPVVLDALPEELIHRVTFRLTAEQVAGSEVVRTDLLTHEAASSDLAGAGISLVHPQPASLENIGVAISGVIGGYRNFVPSLLVGEETIFGTPVTFGTGDGLLDTFGGGATDGDTLAEWLEITVTTPERKTIVTRTIFDRVGDDARAAGPVDPTIVAPVEFVDSSNSDGNFLPLAGLWTFAVVTGDVPESQTARSMPQNPTIDDALPALHAYHYARNVEAIRHPALGEARTFIDAPNVTAYVLLPTEVNAANQSAGVALDLLHRSHRVIPAPQANAPEVHPLVASGALAHAVELAMFESVGLAPFNQPVSATSGVLRVFAAAKDAGIATRVITAADGSDVLPNLPAGSRRLVGDALATGRIVIIPERPVELGGRDRIGWWLVDPATGVTIDQMDDGGGSTMTEYVTLLIEVAACITWFLGLALTLGAVARIAAYSMSGTGSSGDISKAGAALGLGGAGAIAGAASCG